VPFPPWVLVLLVLAAGTLWVVLLANFTSYLSGWWRLSRHYRHRGHFDGTRRRFRSVSFGWSNYNGAVTVGTNSEGLYLAMFLLFRPGHPPLFVPWADVTAEVVKGWFWSRYLELRFAEVPGLRVRVPLALGREIAADANRAWDGISD
jgi:hypothetical protein